MATDVGTIFLLLLVGGAVLWRLSASRNRPRAKASTGVAVAAAAAGILTTVGLYAWLAGELGLGPGLHSYGGLFAALVLYGCGAVGLLIAVVVYKALLPWWLERAAAEGVSSDDAAASEAPVDEEQVRKEQGKKQRSRIVLILAVGAVFGAAYLGRAYQVSPSLHTDGSLIRKACDPSHPMHGAAISELRRRGSEVLPALVQAASDPSSRDPSRIPGIVSRIGGDDATAALVVMLGGEHPAVRYRAALALGGKQHPAAVDVLLSLLDTLPRDGPESAPIVRTIAGYGRPELYPKLVEVLGGASASANPAELDAALVTAACTLRHPSALEVLESRARSASSRVRKAVAKHTVCYRSRRSASVAMTLLSDSDSGVRVAANVALAGLAGLDGPVVTAEVARRGPVKASQAWRSWLEEHPGLFQPRGPAVPSPDAAE